MLSGCVLVQLPWRGLCEPLAVSLSRECEASVSVRATLSASLVQLGVVG